MGQRIILAVKRPHAIGVVRNDFFPQFRRPVEVIEVEADNQLFLADKAVIQGNDIGICRERIEQAQGTLAIDVHFRFGGARGREVRSDR